MNTPRPERFTLDGSDALEAHLAATCRAVLEGVGRTVPSHRLQGLLLAGGYGRGEGGVLSGPEGDRPYNDLEFYVFIRGHALVVERRYRAALHELGHRLSPAAQVEVEFKVLSLPKLRNSPPSMFYYDLVAGHRWLLGNDALLAGCEHHREPSRIPLHEATRLLLNRCSGLLFSAERLLRPQFGAEESDFTGRNLAKAQLALGDVLLTVRGQYHWSCRERAQRVRHLRQVPWLPAIVQHHDAGVAFKLRPCQSVESRGPLLERHNELCGLSRDVWLWLESLRLGRSFQSVEDYAFCRENKCPETAAWKNLLLNLRTFGLAQCAHRAARYPRERLLDSLPLLLWTPEPSRNPRVVAALQQSLGTAASDFPSLVQAYTRLWSGFN